MDDRKISRIVATYGDERRDVIVSDVTDGLVEVRALNFEAWKDTPVWYHGFKTTPENIHDVKVFYTNGTCDFLGEPPVSMIHVSIMTPSEAQA